MTVGGARVEVLGGRHAVIHPDIPVIPNNAYLVDGTHLHPGDSLTWSRRSRWRCCSCRRRRRGRSSSDAVDYLRAVAPRTAVPIHQGILAVPGMYYGHFERLGPEKTAVQVLDAGHAGDPVARESSVSVRRVVRFGTASRAFWYGESSICAR